MTIFRGLPFVLRVIIMNAGFVSSGFETISVKKFWSNSFPVFLHGVSQLSLDTSGANFV